MSGTSNDFLTRLVARVRGEGERVHLRSRSPFEPGTLQEGTGLTTDHEVPRLEDERPDADLPSNPQRREGGDRGISSAGSVKLFPVELRPSTLPALSRSPEDGADASTTPPPLRPRLPALGSEPEPLPAHLSLLARERGKAETSPSPEGGSPEAAASLAGKGERPSPSTVSRAPRARSASSQTPAPALPAAPRRSDAAEDPSRASLGRAPGAEPREPSLLGTLEAILRAAHRSGDGAHRGEETPAVGPRPGDSSSAGALSPAVAAALAPRRGAAASGGEAPTVQVRIGRVDVRAPAPTPPAAPRRPRPAGPRMTLADYMKARREARR